ncbi:hypothetical protein KC331_g9596 [Hortaea werneckii]|uniref:Uncharacterized protein n=1 Tax=Hortaea werneckii TaxID=91943 RepID=A0A3M7B114_HORWE|nr:hypothetical protein KC331_g9596 [Hortaea werneckii]RMY33431.1 hypothetical protein D0865_14459 [Hortaea werneckii]
MRVPDEEDILMVGTYSAMATVSGDIDPSCAICGAPPFPECPHESQRLELALDQAQQRWSGMRTIREWVLNHARDQVISTFHQLRGARYQAHLAYLQSLPCFTLYYRYNGAPPIHPTQLQLLHSQIQQANMLFKQGVDEDWRRSCLRYPEVLDYYFDLVQFQVPSDRDPAIVDPRFGATANERPRIREKRPSGDSTTTKEHRKKDRRRSRGRTPPAIPHAPMPGAFH